MKPSLAPTLSQIIYANAAIKILLGPEPTPEIINLLRNTVYGTHGPRYQHTGHENKINHILNPFFFQLLKDEQVIGTYCLSQRRVKIATGEALSFYGRYFSIAPQYKGQGYGSLLKKEAIAYIERTTTPPFFFYSYIEESNQRSLAISKKDGYQPIGTLEAVLFSRLYPQQDARFSRLSSDKYPDMLLQLQTTYQDYTLVQLDRVFYEQNYFVLKENGEIIAGVQANPVAWHIVHMPGLTGKIVMQVLPYVPVLNRLINPRNHQFLALEAVYVKPGHEKALLILLESTLAYFGYTSALLMLDVNCPLRQQLKSLGHLGLMHALNKSIYTQVMVKTRGITQKEIKSYPKQPIYASAFDFS
ncbi:GNAT family N-acetyltransferase [Adhaeribacter rhizoryzae]|uniref:GNAT family N-acetyltransferase n=1 Tax=Adhaeribacter rhizoryzae TaxID=2607907 RepID=A0A5M6DBU9_9BACT|nr:GNAT family N-acetyltransferase [Adhaeribacter rhizoryzae]KAA5545021.1 GNAT family N-acetyltransferase [Adhaeribacter rhizoryzae]